ncbi:trypsin-like peptidase domain-containing protein [Microbacterium sp. KHB019]
MPAAFTSHASQQTAPTEQFTAPVAHFTAPAANTANGSSFGIRPQGPEGIGQDQTAPVTPVATKPREKKSFGAGKVAALIVAASLVGGAAGLGTSYLGSTLWSQPVGSTATGPDTITVNNPGSVNETTAIATEVLPSVVTIQVAGSSESGSGSGVVLSDDGYVLTNTHVVTLGGAEADPTIRVTTSDGHLYNAKVVGTDPIYDLAVIKLEGASDLAPIEFGDSSKLNVGSTAVAIGAPLGLSNSVTTGIVSALNRSIQIASSAVPDSTQDSQDDQGDQGDQGGSPFQFDLPGTQQQNPNSSISISVIQTDAAINPGNSGGALVDSEGKLIGINVAIATAGSSEESGSIGVGFSIPSNIAKRVSEEIIESGAATHGLLGATVQDATSVSSADVAGAVIVDPTPGGPAADAGLKKGDIVTKFNGLPISGATDLTAQVRAAAAGSDATVTYVRGGKTFEVDVTLGELDL